MILDADLRHRLVRAKLALEHGDAPVPVVARSAGIAPFHFIRVFASVFGVTPHQHRIATRLSRARGLLVAGRSVTDVCFEVGFSSVGSFSAAFAQRMGEPPSAFRRRCAVQVPSDLRRALVPGCFGLMGGLPADAFRNFREAAPRRV